MVDIPLPMDADEVNQLPVQLSIAVPSTDDDGQITRDEFEERINNTKKWFDERFGGDTTIRAVGGFLQDDELIEEPVALVESSMAMDTYEKHKDDFGDFVKKKKQQWEQNSILYQIEGRVFIFPRQDFIDDDLEIAREMIKVT